MQVVQTLLDVSSPENTYMALLMAIGLDHDVISVEIINHNTYQQYSKQKQLQIEGGKDSTQV